MSHARIGGKVGQPISDEEQQHQDQENRRADHLLAHEIRKMQTRQSGKPAAQEGHVEVPRSGTDTLPSNATIHKAKPHLEGDESGGVDKWVIPFRVDLTTEMFHDLENLKQFMDDQCLRHRKVFDAPALGGTKEWMPGTSLTSALGIAIYWIHRVRLRVSRKRAGHENKYSRHPIHKYSQWCGQVLCSDETQCPHSRPEVSKGDFGGRNPRDIKPHHRYRETDRFEYLRCGKEGCAMCNLKHHKPTDCKLEQGHCDECAMLSKWSPRTLRNLTQVIQEMPKPSDGPGHLEHSLKTMKWLAHFNWQSCLKPITEERALDVIASVYPEDKAKITGQPHSLAS